MDIVGRVTEGLKDGAATVVGQAAARTVPTLLRLPRTGILGISLEVLSAVAVGILAERVVSRDTARSITAGGVSAPLATLAVAYNVPFLSRALSPASAAAGVSGYLRAYPQGGMSVGVGAYPQGRTFTPKPFLQAYPQGGAFLGSHPSSTYGAAAGAGAGC